MNINKFKPFLFDLQENLKNFKDFLEELKKGNCVALIGAGLSKPLGIPDWEDLIFRLSEFSHLGYKKQYIEKNSEKWLDIAEEAKSHWKKKEQTDKYYNFLQNNLSPINTSYNNTHLVLLEVNFLSYLTTNFDNILDNAAKRVNNGEILNGLQVFPNLDQTFLRHRKIFYLHGKIENKRIVFTRTEYDSAYKHGAIKDVLWSAYSHMNIILIGFSLKDNYIQNLFKNFKEQLNERRTKEEQLLGMIKNTHRHFAFIGTDARAEKKRIMEENSRYEELRVRFIRYALLPNDNHINLERILEGLPKFREVKL